MSNVKSSAKPSIVLPLRATVRFVVLQLAPSTTETCVPVAGVAGRVTVNMPPVVSAITPCLSTNVVALVTLV